MPRAFLMSTKNKLKNVKTDDTFLERARHKTVRTLCGPRGADGEQETSTIDLERLKEENVQTKRHETSMKKGKLSTFSAFVLKLYIGVNIYVKLMEIVSN